MADGTTEQSEAGITEIGQMNVQMLVQEIKDNQNLVLGIGGGIIAAAIGATLWALVTVATNHQIGWMAVGVGFLVGFGVRLCGKGIDRSFGVTGAVFSLLGCFAGNLLTTCIVISRHERIPLSYLLPQLNLETIVGLTQATFNPMDLLFYAISVYEGYKFSFRRISKDELAKGFK